VRTIDENEKTRVIDNNRHVTHRIYDVAGTVDDGTKLLRKCQFHSMTKGGKKIYEKKTLEFKVELYADEKGDKHRDRKRIAGREINLTEYIDKGPIHETLRLDNSKNTQHVYLTFMVHVTSDLSLGEDDEEVVREAEETTMMAPPMMNQLAANKQSDQYTASQVTETSDGDEPFDSDDDMTM
jgi:hypothetical protein